MSLTRSQIQGHKVSMENEKIEIDTESFFEELVFSDVKEKKSSDVM